jgi:hypothetical protein
MTVTKNSYSSIGIADDLQTAVGHGLKLSVDHKHIRYFIFDIRSGQIVFYGDHTLHNVNSDEELAAQMENILAKDTFLNKSFSQVTIGWSTDFEIVPTIYFEPSALDSGASVVDILKGDAKFLFAKVDPVASWLTSKFPLAVHTHMGAAMIDELSEAGIAGSNTLAVNIITESIDILHITDEGSLKIFNSYEYKTYQDYIYYVLLVADELMLDREKTQVYLMGEVSADSKLYEMTQRYFGHVDLLSKSTDIRFTPAFDEYPKHFNYILYNL